MPGAGQVLRMHTALCLAQMLAKTLTHGLLLPGVPQGVTDPAGQLNE